MGKVLPHPSIRDGIVTENKTMKASDFDKKLIVCLRERTLTFFFRTTNPAIAQTIGIAIAATIEAVQVFRRLSKITSEENRSNSS